MGCSLDELVSLEVFATTSHAYDQQHSQHRSRISVHSCSFSSSSTPHSGYILAVNVLASSCSSQFVKAPDSGYGRMFFQPARGPDFLLFIDHAENFIVKAPSSGNGRIVSAATSSGGQADRGIHRCISLQP